MRRAFALVMLLAPACGGGDTVDRGVVEVSAYTDLMSWGPDFGALVVFADRDGTSRTAYIDEQGHAQGEIEAGGSVWLAHLGSTSGAGSNLTAYADVQPGAVLEFGAPQPPSRAVKGTVTFVGDPPTAFNNIIISSSCSVSSNLRQVTFDDRCSATADILVVAKDNPSTGQARITSYAYLTGRPIVDGSTITIAPSEWKEPEPVSIQLTNLRAAFGSEPDDIAFVSDEFGTQTRSTLRADTIEANLPLTRGIQLTLRVGSGDFLQPGQWVHLALPALATQTVDLQPVFAPWVKREQESPLVWSMDDAGGVLQTDAMVTEYEWVQPIANYDEQMLVRVISAVRAPGEIDLPQLPDALADYQPEPGFRVNTSVRLVRVEGGDEARSQRFAEMIGRYWSGTLRFEEVLASSIAISERD